MKWVYRGRSYKARFLDLFSVISQSRKKDKPPGISWFSDDTTSVELATDSTWGRANCLSGLFLSSPCLSRDSGLLPPLSLAPSVLPAFLSGLHSWGLAPGSLLALGFNSKTFQSQWSSLITKWGCQGKNANWKLLFLEVLERLEINTFLLSIMPFA